ncbi:hypothetical protein LTR36_002568 [Oleoguttula mirabilis]|uniref:Heterokaryon incompatibility domain-containing protein n=1 Tax=Oleoguttula mirabilis TaxID=1507867 RepID=A0AAV9JK45_9PEZI|nr:hypothetical protein LTR36_002568 [Oleoguttula mirabilis]
MTTQSLNERLRGSGTDIELVPSGLGSLGSTFNWRQKTQQRWFGQPYQPLDPSKRQIRLIKLLSSDVQADGAAPLKCVIKAHSLDSASIYDAISYCWGSSVDSRVIDVGGQLVPITRNLHAALVTLQMTETAHTWLWIDAISINQEDVDERNAQVPLMKDIFGQAETVHIWLGPQNHRTDLAIGKLDDIYCGRLRGHAILEGDDGVALVDALEALTQCLDATLRNYPHVWNALFHTYRIYNEITAETAKSLIDDDIVDQIGNLAYCNATNARDYVYGLLGLLPPAVAASIKPDYSASVHLIYEDFAVKLMLRTKSLGMLRLCGRQHRCSDLPSWVPDFRRLSHRGYWGHKAASGTWHFLEQSKVGELDVHAYMADEVLAVGQSLPQIRLFEILDGDESKRLRILLQSWRSDHLPYFNMLREETRQSRLSLSRFVAEEPIHLSDPGDDDTLAQLAARFKTWLASVIPALTAGAEKDERLSAIDIVEGEGFFVTKQGRLGIAYVLPQPGDSVAILAGCSYAVAVRSGGADGRYQVVTPCYCDGMMRGEVIREAAGRRFGDEKRVADVLEKITLV